MTRISKYRLEDKVLKKLYSLMFEVISNMDEEERFIGIMNELLSLTEKIMIAKRIAIIYLLVKDIDYLVISDVLKVSSGTIAKFHSMMNKGREIKNILKGITGNEKIKDFFEELFFVNQELMGQIGNRPGGKNLKLSVKKQEEFKLNTLIN